MNASGPPDTWQTFDFKVVGDRLTAKLNGKLIHDNEKLTNTPGQFPGMHTIRASTTRPVRPVPGRS